MVDSKFKVKTAILKILKRNSSVLVWDIFTKLGISTKLGCISINIFCMKCDSIKFKMAVWWKFALCEGFLYSVSQKNPPLRFSDIFPKRLGIFSPNFIRLLFVPIYAWLQIFIQLSPIVSKLCHIMPNTHRRRRRHETVLSRRRRRSEHNSQLAHDDCRTDHTDSIAFDYTNFDRYW